MYNKNTCTLAPGHYWVFKMLIWNSYLVHFKLLCPLFLETFYVSLLSLVKIVQC